MTKNPKTLLAAGAATIVGAFGLAAWMDRPCANGVMTDNSAAKLLTIRGGDGGLMTAYGPGVEQRLGYGEGHWAVMVPDAGMAQFYARARPLSDGGWDVGASAEDEVCVIEATP